MTTVEADRSVHCGPIAARHLAALGYRPTFVEPGLLCVASRYGSVVSTVDCAGPVAVPMVDERTVQAACSGIMHVHGRRYGRPTPLPVPYASSVAGVLAAQGVLAAMLAQARGTAIGSVGTSVAEGALVAVAQYLAMASATDDDWAPAPYLPGGPPFTAADGVRFEIETLDAARWYQFWALLGADAPAIGQGWPAFQDRFATAVCPVPAALHAAVTRNRYPAIVAVGTSSGVSVVPVRIDRAPSGLLPWRFSDLSEVASAEPSQRPREASTVDGSDLVADGYGGRDLGPLAGLVVVDAGRRVQGPLAGRLLRDLGAEVVHIEPPEGDPLRGVPPMVGQTSARFLALNRGKRVLRADLRSPAGRRRVRELVAEADVFLHNWAPGRAAALGLDAEDLAAVRPGLVYAWASGWGDAFGGDDPPIGTDYVVQAHSGVAAAITRPGLLATPSLLTLTDVLGGLVCAEGILAALLYREATGPGQRHGQRVDTSLLSGARVLLDAPPDHAPDPWADPLRTADGYLMLPGNALAVPDRLLAAFRTRDADGVRLRCREEPTAGWIERLAGYGVTATEVTTDLAAMAVDPRFAAALSHDGCAIPKPPWRFAL